MKEIAVCLNGHNLLCDLSGAKHITLLERKAGIWCPSRELPCQPEASTPATLRAALRALAAELGDCRILLCSTVSGIAYQELTRLGFALFEAETLSNGLLDGVWEDAIAGIASANAKPDVPKLPVSPYGDGHYTFDLIAAQMADPELSSKRALQGFLENQDFLSLELVCDHLPPWAQDVIARRNLHHSIQRRPQGGLHITITNPVLRPFP